MSSVYSMLTTFTSLAVETIRQKDNVKRINADLILSQWNQVVNVLYLSYDTLGSCCKSSVYTTIAFPWTQFSRFSGTRRICLTPEQRSSKHCCIVALYLLQAVVNLHGALNVTGPVIAKSSSGQLLTQSLKWTSTEEPPFKWFFEVFRHRGNMIHSLRSV